MRPYKVCWTWRTGVGFNERFDTAELACDFVNRTGLVIHPDIDEVCYVNETDPAKPVVVWMKKKQLAA